MSLDCLNPQDWLLRSSVILEVVRRSSLGVVLSLMESPTHSEGLGTPLIGSELQAAGPLLIATVRRTSLMSWVWAPGNRLGRVRDGWGIPVVPGNWRFLTHGPNRTDRHMAKSRGIKPRQCMCATRTMGLGTGGRSSNHAVSSSGRFGMKVLIRRRSRSSTRAARTSLSVKTAWQ